MRYESGFGAMPSIFMVVFMVVFLLVICVFIFGIISSISNYAKNKSSPILTTRAKVVGKRTDVTHHDSFNNETHMSSSTTSSRYFITFETEAGERIELTLSGREYGLHAENDIGELIYQGEWFKQFKRDL